MNRITKCIALAVAGCAAFFLTGRERTGSANEAAASAKAQPAGTINLTGCWIKLKHEATLAADRPGVVAFVVEQGQIVDPNKVNVSHVRREFNPQSLNAPDGANVPRFIDKSEEKGVVAGLRAEKAEAALAVAEMKAANDIEIRFADKAHKLAEAEKAKAEESNRQLAGAVPEIEMKRLQLEIDKAALQIEKARNELKIAAMERDQADAELKTTKVYATFVGLVTRVFKKRGESVRQGDPILEIKSTRTVLVEGYVPVEQIDSVRMGTLVTVQHEAGLSGSAAEEHAGTITFIDVTVQKVTRKVLIKAEIDNPRNRLKAGLTARMTIHPGRKGPALTE